MMRLMRVVLGRKMSFLGRETSLSKSSNRESMACMTTLGSSLFGSASPIFPNEKTWSLRFKLRNFFITVPFRLALTFSNCRIY